MQPAEKARLSLNGIGGGFSQTAGDPLLCLKNYYAFSGLDSAQLKNITSFN
jgi:hypothetical protein